MRSNVCGNCGSSQGPFQRIRVGTRRNHRVVTVCVNGPLDDQGRGLGTLACRDRRDKQDIARWGHELPSVVRLVAHG